MSSDGTRRKAAIPYAVERRLSSMLHNLRSLQFAFTSLPSFVLVKRFCA